MGLSSHGIENSDYQITYCSQIISLKRVRYDQYSFNKSFNYIVLLLSVPLTLSCY